MKMFRLIFVFVSFVCLTAEKLNDQIWTNFFEDFSSKIHDYQSDKPIREKNPFDEGFLLLANTQKKSVQTNITPTTTCHTVTSTISTSLIQITTEETSTKNRFKRSPIDDDVEMKDFLSIDDDDGKVLEALLKAGPTVDASGFTEETTSTSTAPPLPEITSLTGFSEFFLTINPTNAQAVWENFLTRLNATSYSPTNLQQAQNALEQCNSSSTSCNIPLNFNTTDDIGVLNELFQTLENIAKELNTTLNSVNRCGNSQTVAVNNVDSCYLITLCGLCGRNPPRGVCLPKYNVSRCECFADSGDPLEPYAGEFCLKTKRPLTTVTPSWTPVVIGVLSGVAGLFLAVTALLTFAAWWQHNSLPNVSNPGPIQRMWHLPRAKPPQSATAENDQPSLNDSPSVTNSDSMLPDPNFFQDLDDQLNANSSPLSETYDPIHELDGIIDNEDISSLFHDASDENPMNSQPFDVVNPHIRL